MSAALPSVLDYPVTTPPAPGHAVEIAPRVLWLRMPLPFALDHINLWVLVDDDGYTLVDCGYGDARTRALWEQHFATTLADRPVRRIVVTHCHPDHVGNAAWLAERFAVPVTMTHAEFLTAHAIAGEHSGYGVASILGLFERHGMRAEELAPFYSRGNAYRHGVPALPSSYARILAGDEIRAAGTAWRVIEGHGHSPEHASLHSAGHAVLIAGDMLLPRISTNVSVWGVEPDADPVSLFLRSLSAYDALSPDTLVLPSHGLPFRGMQLRIAQLRAHHAARLDELAEAIAASPSPLDAVDVVPVLFRRELDLQQRYFAMGEAIAHLNCLWHAGRIERFVDDRGTFRFAASPPAPQP